MPIDYSEEYLNDYPCFVCGKVWQRKDAEKWVYFRNILACKKHPGVTDWYFGALKMVNEKVRLEFEAPKEKEVPHGEKVDSNR